MTNSPGATEPADPLSATLSWDVETADVPANGAEFRKSATAAEREALAKSLNLLSCENCTATYRIRRLAGDRYGLRGTLSAEVVQACVITLAPVYDTATATFSVEFRPADEAAAEGGTVDLDDETDIEPIDGHRLAVGRVVFEELAAALNPYPRRPGAEYSPPAEDASVAKNNPFAALAKLKAANNNSGS
jgi:uncharacterized metal-binding protein YceD (DUF177 family)